MKKTRQTAIESLALESYTTKEEIKLGKTVLVSCLLEVPRCVTKSWCGAGRFNRYTREMAEQRLRYGRTVLAREAKKRLLALGEGEDGFVPSTLSVSYQVHHNAKGLLSITYDLLICEGAEPPDKVRYADNWSFETGYPLLSLISPQEKRAVLARCEEECTRHSRGTSAAFSANTRKALRRHFKAEQSFFGEKGVSVFFQPALIAPYREGVVSFEGVAEGSGELCGGEL